MTTRTWQEILDADPEHSQRYLERWESFIEAGRDIDGEARLVDAMAQRGARILDAGCGQGRTGAYLARQGHRVVGVDLDPVLIGHARTTCPEAEWHVADLVGGEYPEGPFDLIVSAGNVLAFLAPHQRVDVLAQLERRLAADPESPGRLVVGFGLDRGWTYDEFEADAGRAGLTVSQRFSTWDLRPFEDGGFLVAVLTR